MATMKDVAKRADVSIATVSNYLNRTKNVGRSKRLQIEKAIKELNYVLDPNAQLLKKGENNKIGIILPYMSRYYNNMFEGLKGVLTKNNYKLELVITNDEKEFENAAIERFLKEHVSAMIISTCQPNNADIFERLNELNMPFMLLEREVHDLNCNYISFDNYNTVKILLRGLLKSKRNICIVAGPEGFRTEDDSVAAYIDILKEKNIEASEKKIIRTQFSEGTSFYSAVDFLNKNEGKIDYYIVTSPVTARGLKSALLTRNPEDHYKIICLGESINDSFVQEEGVIYTPRSPYLLGQNAALILVDNIKSPIIFERRQTLVKDPESLLNYFIEHFNDNIDKISNNMDDTITVLILEDPLSSNLRNIKPDFEARTGIRLNIEACSMNNYYDYLMQRLSTENKPDLFMIDVPWIDYFSDTGMILKLDDFMEKDKYYPETFVQRLLKSFSQSEGHYYALPYSYTNQLLFYRKDLFEDINLKKDFEEQFKMPLRPPKNWAEFNAIAKFFTRSFNPPSSVEYGTSLAVAYPQAVAPEFLLRLWSMGGDVFDSRGKVIIDSRNCRRAIESYCECFNYSTPNAPRNMPTDQIREFCEGKVAMVIAFFSYGSDIIHSSSFASADQVGFSIVPGKISVLSGWSMCINPTSTRIDSAVEFLKWLCGPETAMRRAFLEGQSSQEHIYSSTELLKLYPWLSTALQSLEFTQKRSMPRVKGKYLAPERTVEDIIGRMIFSVLEEPSKLEEVLFDAKTKLEKIVYAPWEHA